jgi:hypothetical protein|tara:strand:- start:422 stop:901 length:480 start_codon:yes stop_codon:yes gene_type:complete
MLTITVDPGWNGAVALFENNKLLYTEKCPDNRSELKMADIIRHMVNKSHIIYGHNIEAYVEKVWSRPYERGAFSFGKNFGIWLGILASNNLKVHQITPQAWQKVVGVRIPKEYSKRKKYFKRRAQRWAGKKHKVTLADADAICLGMYVIEGRKDDAKMD